MDTDRVGWRLELEYHKGLFWNHLFFTILIDDINEQVLCEISKFADNIKIAIQVNAINDVRSLQRTLDKLVAWGNRWEMYFNVNKCE